MIVKAFLLAFIIVFLSQNSFAKKKNTSPETKLKAVYVTFRAGPAEKPEKEWKLETNVEPTFMETIKLSETGRQNMYDLGKVIGTYYKKKRIITLIPRACPTSRCKASAALFRKGFQNERNSDKKNEVSEEEMEKTYDAELANQRGRFYQNCSNFVIESYRLMSELWTEDKEKMFENTIDVLKKTFRVDIIYPYSISMMWESIYTMSRERPEWMTDAVEKDFKKISAMYFKMILSSTMARKLSAGSLVNKILSDTSKFKHNDVKIDVYAGDYPELEAVVQTFSGPQGYLKIPDATNKIHRLTYLPHGSAMVIEIHELPSGKEHAKKKYGLKILLRVGNGTLFPVLIKGCNREMCPLETAKNLLQNYAIDAKDIDKLCSVKK